MPHLQKGASLGLYKEKELIKCLGSSKGEHLNSNTCFGYVRLYVNLVKTLLLTSYCGKD